MASLRQRGKKKTWYALYRDANGKLLQRSTNTSDRKNAQSMADEWERMARPSEHLASAERFKRVFAEMYRKRLGKELPTMTVRSYAKHWLEVRKREISPASFDFYTHVLNLFVAHLGERADRDLFSVTRHDVVTFRDAQAMITSAATTNHKLKMLRMFFRQANDDGWVPDNPALGVKPAKESTRKASKEKRPFSRTELQRLLAAADPEWKAMIVRGYYTGQRLVDIATMKASQEDPHTKTVTFWTGKTGKRVILEMHPAYVDFVLTLKCGDDPSAPLHPRAFKSTAELTRGKRKGERTKNKGVTLSGQFGRLLAKAGLREKRPHKKATVVVEGNGRRRRQDPLTFHSLRHSFVSHLAEAGVSRSVVQDMVGHESEAVNQLYTHIDRETKRSAIEKLPDITKWEDTNDDH